MQKALNLVTMLGVAAIFAGGCVSVQGKNEEGMKVVQMSGLMRYDPAEITITAGDTVMWKNTSLMVHTVTADPSLAKKPEHVALPPNAQAFDSGNISPGKTFEHTFTVPGTYKYFCIPHESMGMLGTVIVREKK